MTFRHLNAMSEKTDATFDRLSDGPRWPRPRPCAFSAAQPTILAARTHALHRPRKNCRVPDHSFLHPTRCLFHPPPLQPGFSYQRCRRRLLCRRVAKQTCYSCRICITCLTFSCVSSSIGAYLFENGDDTNKGKAN
jgi:hypothetical protein